MTLFSIWNKKSLITNQPLKTIMQKKESLTKTENKDSSLQQIKDKYYLSINNTISSLCVEIDSLNEQLLGIEKSIEQSEMIAEVDGVLVYTQDYSVGDSLSAGTVVGTLVPTTENYEAIIYIPEYSIAEISVEQEIEYVFSSISATDFGKVYGEITEISKDSFVD